MIIDTTLSPFTLTLLFLLLLGDGDVVAGMCSLLWLFVPVGRRAPWNSVRHFEVRVPVDDSEDDDETREENTDENTDENRDETRDESENRDETKYENETEVVPPSVSWSTYLIAQ